MQLQNATVVVTGGSSGIGKATAQLLIEKGAKVLITGRNAEKLEKVAQEIGATALALDMADSEQFATAAQKVQDIMGAPIDVLINNAGIGEFAPLGELSLEQFQKVYMTNVFGLSLLTQAFLPQLKAQKGNIVNIASTAGLKGFATGSIYASSKFALRGLTQCWQAELRPHNIRVQLVNPSEVTTAFNQKDRVERAEEAKKLRSQEIAHAIASALEMDDRGFIPELTVWATNPF
ncbi:SDR family oxidoreductase [Saprospira grandis]|uniref:3-ketoacyl-(Acyl-carrier-protein) reductase n=1 Tax=Saprospira grandis (strain Lewin) TaxID=984262 RepID=H6LAM9_SAPGL|nr:SDR family oxidoreductase [Saprospira grandis]AFC25622.1 3-ketoacyl-(acyl-carrier-protein) reductase [Saprospira grandis str. Lewin]